MSNRVSRPISAVILALALALSMLCSACSSAADHFSASKNDSAAAEAADSSLYASLQYTADSPAGESAEKIIRNMHISLETTEFSSSVSAISSLAETMGGYVESSSIENRGGAGNRRASFTLRLPSDKLDEVPDVLAASGNLLSVSTGSENITTQFVDTEARLAAKRVEEQRLLELVKQAGSVSELLEVENRLAEVRYEIESMQSTLSDWQKRVDFSEVSISLVEVLHLSGDSSGDVSYGARMASGFRSTLRGVGLFFSEAFLVLVSLLPVLIPAAAVVVLVIVLVRRSRRKRAADRADAAAPPQGSTE